ncbi:6-phosphogluconolactonase [Jhaorihella thermophila]|uniref:6-phosphogluconolactonase n=1 Tax=Jhaorihella thermophila TaxID=488547 RepID=A0A1H5RXY0_9RHOB|nr:6-phosphogluconolactonase [Jhaorihella thermophila]SEF43216.1 6-phosphogluconolactonase [Jhaorihella thermophila]
MNLVEYADRDLLAMDVANLLAGELKSALLARDTVSFAVPGGTTPGPIFDALCAANLDWDRVYVLPTDERWVPQDSERSNGRLITSRLLVNRAAAAQFLPLHADTENPEDVLPELEAQIAPHLPLSVLLLGMGADMHVASLFPGAPGLAEALAPDAPILAVTRPASQPEPRVTLTAPVLNGALSKHIVILGKDKREALEKARFLEPDEAPVTAVLSGATVHWAE